MRGRTTFVIAHRLSTIALADDIVVLGGRARRSRAVITRRCSRESPLYAEIATKGLPDQVFLNRDPVETGGRAVSARRDDLVRRWRSTSGRGRKLRGLIALLSPYRGRVALMFVSLVFATAAALAPPPLAALAIDKGIVPGDLTALTWVVVAFLVSRRSCTGARPTRRPTSSAGSASARCRTCGSSSSRTCRACRSASTRASAPAC